MNDEIANNATLRSVPAYRRFLTTQWQLIRSAGDGSNEGIDHLDRLLRLYLPTLNQFLLNRYRLDPATTEDLLQGFVTAKILYGDLVKAARPGRGRFRNLLLASLTNYTISEIRKLNAAKRIPESAKISWDEISEIGYEPLEAEETPDTHLTPSLNEAIIAETVKRFRWHCDRRGKLIMWEVFGGRLVKPLFENTPPEDYSQLVIRLSLGSKSQATNLLMAAKRSFVSILRKVIEEYALDVDDAELELKQLRRYCGIDTVPSSDRL